MSEEWKQPYLDYLRSPKWKKKRAAALKRAKSRCQRCGAKDRLQVHHLTYERLFNERAADLMVVCVKCHRVEDDLRVIRTDEKMRAEAIDGWARRTYGSNYQDHTDPLRIAEAYDRWNELIADCF